MNKLDKFCKLIKDYELQLIKYNTPAVLTATAINLAREIFGDEPTLKPVDLSVLIKSSIDCEFSTHKDFPTIQIMINKLESFSPETRYVHNGWNAPFCRPRMTPFIHASPNGFDSCPLPDGLEVIVWWDLELLRTSSTSEETPISRPGLSNLWKNIIAFEVLGLADGFCWPWDVDDE